VPKEQLPVKLPGNATFGGEGNPLLSVPEWVNTTCPKCGGPARRETDTMDTFFDSSWYFIRYCDPHNAGAPIDPQVAAKWLPVDHYIGGKEHAILHLLYARFFTKMMRDMGLVAVDEPFKRLLTQGMVLNQGRDPRTGESMVIKMSKSVGNVVDPGKIIAEMGADVARMFILFAAPPEKDLEWSDTAVEGMARFVNRIWRFVQNHLEFLRQGMATSGRVEPCELELPRDCDLLRLIHETTRRVTADMAERFQFNTAISACMELLNGLYDYAGRPDDMLSQRLAAMGVARLALLVSPFAPHLAEEVWSQIGGAGLVAEQPWPAWDEEALKQEAVEIALQVGGKVRGHLMVGMDEDEASVKARALADEKVIQFTAGKQVKKVVYVKHKLVSIVAV
jgi:leucyl-tRNA synthetase